MKASWNFAGLLVGLLVNVAMLPAAGSAADAGPANPTFAKDVLPIFQKSCQACHRPGQMAPFSLLTYESARPWARSIKSKVESRYMPPWHVDRTVGEYSPDPSLSDDEIAIISKWVDAGAPRGDMKDAPAPIEWAANDAWQFGEDPDLIIKSPAMDVPAQAPDMHPEPEVPSGITEDRFIKWIQLLPGDTTVTHHVLVYALSGFPTILTEYARGNAGDIFPDGGAKLLPQGGTIRFQIHYHPNGETSVVGDQVTLGIKFWPAGYKPKHLIQSRNIQNETALAIAPGDPNSPSDAYFTLTQAARLVSFQPHMHYRGKRMTLEAIPPTGEPQLLTDVDRFVWTWQITYFYKNPPAFPKGTVLHVTAYHDNSAANKDNPDPSAFVGWGDRTMDEMNVGWVDYYDITDEEYALRQEQSGR